ncbi:MAG: type II toxin-antitoxin system RelE/ParE family toxin [Arcobacteraceae bacterium]
MKIIETQRYKVQLREITLNIKKDKPQASVKFAKDLKEQINNISNMPKKYRKSEYYEDENIRDMIFRGYTIIYELYENIIEIQTIFNQNLPLLKNEQNLI